MHFLFGGPNKKYFLEDEHEATARTRDLPLHGRQRETLKSRLARLLIS